MHNNYGYLLVALLGLLIGTPMLEDLLGWNDTNVAGMTYIFVLALGIWSLRGARRWFVVGGLLAASGVLINIVHLSTGHPMAMFTALGLFGLFLGLCIVLVMRDIVGGTEVDLNRIAGAISVYLLLGALWSVAYSALFAIDAQAFAGLSVADAAPRRLEFQYFSFVTLTTLGYGDLLPVSNTARALVMAETITGQFYIAILVAALVSAYVSSEHEHSG
jgi:voltage-gated potassium channel